MAEENKEGPKLHIDSDWKAQARAEKEKLAQKAKQAPQGSPAGGGMGGLPPASMETLISTLATQALLYMGAIAEPRSGQRLNMPEVARHHIDLLGVIEEKTKGNLTEEEDQMLAGTLYELRSRYIQMAGGGRG